MIIEENFLTSKELETVQENITNNQDFPWYRVQRSSSEDYPFYCHTLIKREEFIEEHESEINSSWYNFFSPILDRFIEKHKIYKGDYQIMRCAINDTLSFSDKGCDIHVDYEEEHLVFMIYLTDSSGDTIFYTKQWKEGEKPYFTNKLKNSKRYPKFKVKQKITPKKGKMICYNGVNYHSHDWKQPNERRVVCVFGLKGEQNK
mgnify:FL=1|tara:strand:- start:68 stop:676 length:609 start_codon:yes stop_codon:yes gene_type:complete